MHRSEDFRRTVRHGVRAGRPTLVVHAWRAQPAGDAGLIAGSPESTAAASVSSPQVGFVVSKAVGSAVQRNRVRRRLRHLCVPHLAELAPGTLVVVRALPPAASAGPQLGSDLQAAWQVARQKLTTPARRGPR